MVDHVGQQVGNYQLTHLLGVGGFAEVYLGKHVHLETEAAIKVLTARLTSEEIERFRNEARMIARLRHPSIVRILDFGVENTVPFLIMDYIPNGTLRNHYRRGTQQPLEIIIPHVKQISAALQYAHNQKLIHRDVKPENMLLESNSDVFLSDFGIAVVAHSSRSMKTQDEAGTLPYMAPEQLQGKPRIASDQYALGVVVYEWLAGAKPFEGTAWEIVSQHLSTPPPPLRGKIPALSPMVEQVVLKALEKDPQNRFPSVQEFAEALERANSPEESVTLSSTIVVSEKDKSTPGKTKEQWMKEGDNYAAVNQYSAAITAYGNAITLDPNDAVAYFKRGLAYHFLRNYREAVADYDRTLALDPSNISARNNRAGAYRYLTGEWLYLP